MKNKLVNVFALFMAVSLACITVTGPTPSPSDSTGDETPQAPIVQADGFSVEATTEGSVLLKWEPISGAKNYLLEVQIGDEFVELASLPADQLSYEDTNVPPDTRFTYRLSTLASSEQGKGKESTVQTPQVVSNPLKVSIEFDQTEAAIDLNNFDPNTFDPNTFDPNTFDPSQFMPQPVQSEAVIGPQGGEVSVTGSNGVIYTLSVPPDALRYEIPITLRSISAIPDLPLSGGLMAAVFVGPETLVFDIPATLKMTMPADSPAATGPLVMAFAFAADGQEFHLHPFAAAGGQSSMGTHLASLQAVPNFAGPPPCEIKYGSGYGQGSGTAEDVKNISRRPATLPQDRAAHELAVSQLNPPTAEGRDFGKFAESILQKAVKADDWGKLLPALDDFSTYINAGGDKYNKVLIDKILDLLVEKAKKLLEKNKGDCLTYDDFNAQELVERLTFPKDKFSKGLAERFKQKYGQTLLDDLAFARKTCSYELTLDSKLTYTTPERETMTTTAKASKMKLFLTYSKGEIYLSGGGVMAMTVQVSGTCSFPIKHYDSLTFNVLKLTPIFEYGLLKDFSLSQYAVNGWKKAVSVSASDNDSGCPSLVAIQGGGDYWTGMFLVTRFSLGDRTMTGWKIYNDLTQGNSLEATWNSDENFDPLGIQGKSTEHTKFTLKVTKNSK